MNSHPERAFVNQMLVFTLVGLGFGGSIGVGSVWLRHQISIAANDDRVIEAKIAEAGRREDEVTTLIAQEQDDSVLLRRNAEWRLGLVPPRGDQIQWITFDAAARLAAKGGERANPPARTDAVPIRIALQP